MQSAEADGMLIANPAALRQYNDRCRRIAEEERQLAQVGRGRPGSACCSHRLPGRAVPQGPGVWDLAVLQGCGMTRTKVRGFGCRYWPAEGPANFAVRPAETPWPVAFGLVQAFGRQVVRLD